MATSGIPESFFMYLWRSPNLPETLYAAQGFEETEALYKGLGDDGYIVKLIHMATNAEFELSAGRLCPAQGLSRESPSEGTSPGPGAGHERFRGGPCARYNSAEKNVLRAPSFRGLSNEPYLYSDLVLLSTCPTSSSGTYTRDPTGGWNHRSFAACYGAA
jgi:hypothetical protein